jgi:hypothetical protein
MDGMGAGRNWAGSNRMGTTGGMGSLIAQCFDIQWMPSESGIINPISGPVRRMNQICRAGLAGKDFDSHGQESRWHHSCHRTVGSE